MKPQTTTKPMKPQVTKMETTTTDGKRKTIKETVETLSEDQKNVTVQLSEDTKDKSIQLSNQILEGTNPISQNIYESSLSRSEMSLSQINNPPKEQVPFNYDEIMNSISLKLDEYSNSTYNDVQHLSIGMNDKSKSINKEISTICLDVAEGALLIVDEKSKQVLNEIDLIRSKVNTDVNIGVTEELNMSTKDIESKMDSLSTKTNENMNNISDNILRNILSI